VHKCIGGAPDGREVVGIAGDVRSGGLRSGIVSEAYFPTTQVPQSVMWLAVRGAVPVVSLTTAVRKAVATVDPSMPVAAVATMEEIIARNDATQRFVMVLLIVLAAVGSLIATVGIYGVIAYMVTQRTKEIGVRMALGARPGRLAGSVLMQGITLAVIGVVVGGALAAASTKVLSSMLFEVNARDPVTFGLVAVVLVAVAAAASFVPAWRATRVDPLTALRSD
jgi:ABC-type antimicrobial peptide transport system permease subunit